MTDDDHPFTEDLDVRSEYLAQCACRSVITPAKRVDIEREEGDVVFMEAIEQVNMAFALIMEASEWSAAIPKVAAHIIKEEADRLSAAYEANPKPVPVATE